MNYFELNMDGLVGPTHHYAGLSPGNIASTSNALSLSNPHAAARQGLEKMRLLHRMGLKQAVLPPHPRPNLRLLEQLGFQGNSNQKIEKAYKTAPELLSACYSASSMWTANAATVSSSLDSQDQRMHFTAANLVSNLHRHQEADFSAQLLQAIFANEEYFAHHPVLPKSMVTGDEGAANHNRFCRSHGQPGLNLFVHGIQALTPKGLPPAPRPLKYPARQSLEASMAIARAHQLAAEKTLFACQNPQAIDQGVFHNDVISVANESVFLVHEEAFLNQAQVYEQLKAKADFDLQIIEVDKQRVSMTDAVGSYLFNSQLITLPDASMMLVAPSECEENQRVNDFIQDLISDASNPINKVHFLDLKQSMRNGGGPACLRLRVPISERELQAMHQGVLINETLLSQLEAWVDKHYRTQLSMNDLRDPALINETEAAYYELSVILKLDNLYYKTK